MAPPLIQLRDIHLTFGGTPLLSGAELALERGERVCLVGRNGSGKSTLLKMAAGLVTPDGGDVFVQPNVTMRYLPQEPDFSAFTHVRDYVLAGLGPSDDPYAAELLLGELGLSGEENVKTLSGGEARRAALARILAPSPDVLLLDEPTNHLDLPTIEWLENYLLQARAALLLISHDRRFLTALSQATIWLDRGETQRLNEGFASFEAWRDERLAQEERDQHKLDRKIVAEEHWLRYGVTARRKRNVKRLGNLIAMRQARRDYRGATGNATLEAAVAEPSGTLVIEAKNLSKQFGERPIVRDFSIRIQRGDRLGIVGPNGSGKTTLLSMLTGQLAPDSGSIRHGANLAMATLDQHREALHPDTPLADALTGGGSDTIMVGTQAKHVSSYLKDFLFATEQMRTPLRALSGGERGRLMLARALARPSNILVLDEPTNDLDIETLDVLEDMLANYQGTVFLISHDRDFLDRVVTSVLVPDGGGRWTEYAGGYSDMLKQRGADIVRETKAARAKAPDNAAAKPAVPQAAQPKRRLSFNEKHALETLPGLIAQLEKSIATFQDILLDPALFARDRQTFDKTSQNLAKAQAQLAQAEEKWLALEMLREDIENG